jgi:hypothetical protein
MKRKPNGSFPANEGELGPRNQWQKWTEFVSPVRFFAEAKCRALLGRGRKVAVEGNGSDIVSSEWTSGGVSGRTGPDVGGLGVGSRKATPSLGNRHTRQPWRSWAKTGSFDEPAGDGKGPDEGKNETVPPGERIR